MRLLNTCGIISYIGKDNGIPCLIEGIRKLEYRGYDSFGCAFRESGRLTVLKDSGRIDEVIDEFDIGNYKSGTGIFHTRWATHGEIGKKNAHPLTDCNGEIAIAHNGIIENWGTLKEGLNGHRYLSDTDSELIAHMIEAGMHSGLSFYDSAREASLRIEGSSSFVAIHAGINEMVAVKNGSPLILAPADSGFFISSDIPSVLGFTDRIVYLHDGDIVHLTPEEYFIENIFNEVSSHEEFRVNRKFSESGKGDYAHFMEKEIFEQPGIWNSVTYLSSPEIKAAAEALGPANRIFLIGSGSSYFASLYGARILRERGLDAFAFLPQDIDNYSSVIRKDDVFIFVSQSGETADIISRLDRLNGQTKIGIINVDHSFLTTAMDIVIPMQCGVENAVAATKSLTSSMIILTLIAEAASGRFAHVSNDYKLLKLNAYNLPVPSIENAIDRIAELISGEEHLYIAGKGGSYILALEGALKMKEVTYIHTEALDLASLKHGPLAMIEPGTKVIAIMGDGDSSYNVDELKTRGAFVIGIANSKSSDFDAFVRTVPAGEFSFAPVLFVLHLLAYRTSVRRGINPDRPRNLAKSVTVK